MPGQLRLVQAILPMALLMALSALGSGGSAAQDNSKIEVIAQLGHSKSVNSVVYSPDGHSEPAG